MSPAARNAPGISVTSLLTGKYMRPLLLQGAGGDSDTWAGLLRTYGYRTAAFYPPAVFFIDQSRFQGFEKRSLDFEYRWVEFAEGEKRLKQVREYLASAPRDKPFEIDLDRGSGDLIPVVPQHRPQWKLKSGWRWQSHIEVLSRRSGIVPSRRKPKEYGQAGKTRLRAHHLVPPVLFSRMAII